MPGVRWAFDIGAWKPTESQWIIAASCIQPEEKMRIGKFVFQQDAKASIIGRLLMRKFVSESCTIPYAAVKFGRDEKGKPFVFEPGEGKNVSFNVSHQGNFTVLAGDTTYGSKIGVDVMKIDRCRESRLDDFFRLMNRQFTSSEWNAIQSSGDELGCLSSFYRHWCLKESYVKAVGVGIGIELASLSFSVKAPLPAQFDHAETGTTLSVNGKIEEGWKFEESLLDAEHCVAVAIKDSNFSSVPFSFLKWEDIIENYEPLLPPDSVYCYNYFKKLEKP